MIQQKQQNNNYKTADLHTTGDRTMKKITWVELYDLKTDQEHNRVLPSDCPRIQDFVDALNYGGHTDYIVLGWYYEYTDAEIA